MEKNRAILCFSHRTAQTDDIVTGFCYPILPAKKPDGFYSPRSLRVHPRFRQLREVLYCKYIIHDSGKFVKG